MTLQEAVRILCEKMPDSYQENGFGIAFFMPGEATGSMMDETIDHGAGLALSTCYLLQWLAERGIAPRLAGTGKHWSVEWRGGYETMTVTGDTTYDAVHAAAVTVLQGESEA